MKPQLKQRSKPQRLKPQRSKLQMKQRAVGLTNRNKSERNRKIEFQSIITIINRRAPLGVVRQKVAALEAGRLPSCFVSGLNLV